MRPISLLLASALAIALPAASAIAGPGNAASPMSEVERTLRQAENTRRNGSCWQRDRFLSLVEKQLELLEFYAARDPAGPVSATDLRNARTALANERARSCTNTATEQASVDAIDSLPPSDAIPPAQGSDGPIEERMSEAVRRLVAIRDANQCDVTRAVAWLRRLRQIANEYEELFRGAVRAGGFSETTPAEAFDRWMQAQRQLHRWEIEVRVLRIRCAREQSGQNEGGSGSTGGGGGAPDEGGAGEGPGGSGGPADIGSYAQDSIRPGRLTANFGFRGGETNVPTTGIGFRREGPPGTAPEEFADVAPDSLFAYGGGILFDFGNFALGASYFEGDGSSTFDIGPGGGIDAGVVFGGPAPSGSSGLATPFGLSGTMDVEFSQWSAGGSLPVLRQQSGDTALLVDFTARYDYLDRDYMGTAAGSGASGGFQFAFSQLREQSLEEHVFELGLSGKAIFNARGGLRPFIRGSAGAYYIDTDFKSFERNISNFGPPGDQDFTLTFDGSDDGIGFHGTISGGVIVPLSGNVSVVVGGKVEYRSDLGAIFNPNSGDQVFFDGLTTDLVEDDLWSWQVGVGISIAIDD